MLKTMYKKAQSFQHPLQEISLIDPLNIQIMALIMKICCSFIQSYTAEVFKLTELITVAPWALYNWQQAASSFVNKCQISQVI